VDEFSRDLFGVGLKHLHKCEQVLIIAGFWCDGNLLICVKVIVGTCDVSGDLIRTGLARSRVCQFFVRVAC
jgi:hypothetical protein